jgi:hypothetical protein
MSLLQLRNVSKLCGEGAAPLHAVEDVELSVDRGALVAVTGPSGGRPYAVQLSQRGHLCPRERPRREPPHHRARHSSDRRGRRLAVRRTCAARRSPPAAGVNCSRPGLVSAGILRIAQSASWHWPSHDVTVRGNSVVTSSGLITGYRASPGWDPVAGWGSPDARLLVPGERRRRPGPGASVSCPDGRAACTSSLPPPSDRRPRDEPGTRRPTSRHR